MKLFDIGRFFFRNDIKHTPAPPELYQKNALEVALPSTRFMEQNDWQILEESTVSSPNFFRNLLIEVLNTLKFYMLIFCLFDYISPTKTESKSCQALLLDFLG